MARRRKQINDPRQLSLFDAMANQIEQIRAENIQDDMREESISAPASQTEEQPTPAVPVQAEAEKEEARQPKPAREEMPFPFPVNDEPSMQRLGVNGKGDSVYELKDGPRMYSRNPDIMQVHDGEKRTPEKLFEAGTDDYLTVLMSRCRA